MREIGNGEKPSMLECWDDWMGRTEVGGQKVELKDRRPDAWMDEGYIICVICGWD